MRVRTALACLTALLLTGAAAMSDPGGAAREGAGPRRPGTAERKVMNQWVGTWDGTSSGDATDLLPRARHFAGTYTAAWILEDQYVQGQWVDRSGKAVNFWVMNYDPQRKVYRMWFFDRNGASAWTGRWDEATCTMTWQTTDSEVGGTALDKTRFLDDDHQEWHMRVTDRDGKTQQLHGKLARRK
jgi:hypothetical protein